MNNLDTPKTGTIKKLGFYSVFFLGINSIIGSGIFLLPNKAYSDVGTASILVILLNTLLALTLALCFAESASRFSKNGSAFVYAKAAFGNFVGFEVGVFTWFIGIASFSAEVQGFLTALSSLYPNFADPVTNKISVIVICIFLALLNYSGVKFSKILNNVITVSKLIPLLFFIIVGIFFIKGSSFTPVVPKMMDGLSTGMFGAATLTIFYAFTGFDLMAVASEDMDNPKKNLPKAIICAIAFCSIFYMLIMLVSIGTLGDALGKTSVPIAAATAAMIGDAGFMFITIGSLVSIGGITIALSFIAPHSAEALAENGYLPAIFKQKSRFDTPGYAIALTTLIVIALATYGNFIFLAGVTVVARLVEYIPTALSVIVLRRRTDAPPAGYQIPFSYLIPGFALVVSTWLLFQASLDKLLFGAAGLLLGLIFYRGFVANKSDKNIAPPN